METSANRALGDYGEALACRYLQSLGYEILDRNWRCVRGEIDIVAADPGDGDSHEATVICEVKTRSSEAFGAPFEAVTRTKVRRLRSLAGLWLDSRPDNRPLGSLRLDVVSILRPSAGPARIKHLRGVG